MKLQSKAESAAKFKTDVLVIPVYDTGSMSSQPEETQAINKALNGILETELSRKGLFKAGIGETLVLHPQGTVSATYVVAVGLGKLDSFTSTRLRRAAAAGLRAVKKLNVSSAAFALFPSPSFSADTVARLMAEGIGLGGFQFKLRKTTKPDEALPTELELVTILTSGKTDLSKAIAQGEIIARVTNQTRTWVADSPNFVTPQFLADSAKAISGKGITCKILEQSDLEKLGAGAILNVAKGSVLPPKLVHLTYKPSGTPKKRVALVGKGITFDSGGLSLKPPAAMEWMKTDMTGAAVVINVMNAIALLGNLDIQVDVVAACCENMPSGTATRPGDIVTAMNGKTIEINNTDAEGRLVLCDALTYVQREAKPDEIIDLATLTGACIVALGKEASGIMGNSETLIDNVCDAGDAAGERYWPLPLYDEFKDMLKSDVADYINAGSKGQAGSSAGGMFLKEFIEENRPWVHLDIAGPSYTDKDLPEIPKGATGVGIRTLLYYLYGWNQA